MSLTASQVQVGSQIVGVVKGLGLSPTDTAAAELDAIEGGLAESGLANLGYGDYPSSMGGQMSSSRGVYQQISAWGPYADRTDVVKATTMFLKGGQAGQRGLLSVPGWNTMPSYQAVQAVQGSEFSDGSNYQAQMPTAQDFLAQYAGGAPATAPSAGGGVSNPTASSSSGSGSSGATAAPASFDLPGLLGFPSLPAGAGIGDVVTAATSGVVAFLTESVFMIGGVGLVALGVWRMSAPARQKTEKAVETVARSVPIPV